MIETATGRLKVQAGSMEAYQTEWMIDAGGYLVEAARGWSLVALEEGE